ncbi:MAG: hypothetical protein Q3960_00935 [Lactobacillus sp.]|nr:hypothetical protein [Lactobacillus sp.]
MCTNNLYLKILWVVLYGITLYVTVFGDMMHAMYWMAGTMFVQAVVDVVECLIHKNKC